MFRVVSCLVYEHDLTFVFVAAIVCVAGSLMTMRLFDRVRRVSDRVNGRTILLALSGVAGGAAIWTTHFVAMLGVQLPTSHAYEPVLTVLSFLLAIVFTAGGLAIATRPSGGWSLPLGGGLMGLGVAVMHFTGMAGLEIAGRIEWDVSLLVASVALGVLFGAAATTLAGRLASLPGRLLGAGALTLAICTMHFTAMGAASFVPDPSVPVSPSAMSRELMALSVIATMSIVTGIALLVLDVRTQREVLEGFRHAALHDPLTGAPNRAFLAEKLPAMMEASRAAGRRLAVAAVDLDRFKDVNDVHGHTAGDALLMTLTGRLRNVLRDGEFLARVGGDEFIAVKQDVVADSDARRFAERLTRAIVAPVAQKDRTLAVGASIGVGFYPGDADDADTLMGVADMAMYRAKKQVGKKICFYDRTMDEDRRDKSALAMDMQGALARNEFLLHYQPQIDVGTGEVSGFEALIRWNHPRRGLLPASMFVPIAEETGLILPIGEWVLRNACAAAAAWPKPYRIAVNIAASQLMQAGMPQLVHATLLETGLAPDRLELEITEATIIDDLKGTLHVVRQLKQLGVTIAMDDYGVGYSSLSTLQLLPFDKIKIDRSFVAEVTTNSASSAIVKATILLARNLDIPVLAEGVESQENLDFLKAAGCSAAQGFLIGRPLPLSGIGELNGGGRGPAAVGQPQRSHAA